MPQKPAKIENKFWIVCAAGMMVYYTGAPIYWQNQLYRRMFWWACRNKVDNLLFQYETNCNKRYFFTSFVTAKKLQQLNISTIETVPKPEKSFHKNKDRIQNFNWAHQYFSLNQKIPSIWCALIKQRKQRMFIYHLQCTT